MPRTHELRQHSAGVVTWSHWRKARPIKHMQQVKPGEWYLLHIGNLLARGGQEMRLSVGGANDWCKNLDLDFAATAPVRLSWDIERVIWIGHIKGGKMTAGLAAREHEAFCDGTGSGGDVDIAVQEEMPYVDNSGGDIGAAADEEVPYYDKCDGTIGAATHQNTPIADNGGVGIDFSADDDTAYVDNGGGGISSYRSGHSRSSVSRLSYPSRRVIELILDFSQPTLAAPDPSCAVKAGRWRVF